MPDNYPDLSILYDQLGPMAGAYATGQRQQMGLQSQGLDQANTASLIRARELENLYNDQAMGTRLDQGKATLAQTIAGTQGMALKNQLSQGTMDSTIGATNAANKASIDENAAKGLQAMNQYMGQFAVELGQTPVEQRSSIMAGMLQANPGLKNSPGFNAIMQMDPKDQPQALQQMVAKTNAALPSNQAEMAKINAQGNKQLQAIAAQGAQARMTQQQAIDAGKYQKTGNTSVDMKIESIKNPAERQSALIDAATAAMQNGDQQAAMNYMQRAQSLDQAARNVRANAGAINTTIGATGIENNSRASAVPSAIPAMPQLGPNGPVSGATNKPSLASVQARYPGVPADVLRTKYKQKFGVDLQ